MDEKKEVQETQAPVPVDGPVSQGRREAVRKLGRYALYTAPAMLLLFESEKAAAVS